MGKFLEKKNIFFQMNFRVYVFFLDCFHFEII